MGKGNKISDVYVHGVREFLNFTRRSLGSEILPCPCTHCTNGKWFHFEEIELHLIKWGMEDHYKYRYFHMERVFVFVSEQLPARGNVQLEDCPSAYLRLNNLIDDAYIVYGL